MSLLAKQVEAFRHKHGISERASARRVAPPSVLYSPDDAKRLDGDAVAALALHGISEMSRVEPDVGEYCRMFEGPPRDRDLLMPAEDAQLNASIRRLLLLLSPHLMTRPALEVFEGLLHRYAVHIRNIDDVLIAVLPYHDSPMFTRLVQGLHVEGKPRWAWLKTVKEKPATLLRGTIAKYCVKDLALLTAVGEGLQEVARLHRDNRAMATFFASLWLDTLPLAKEVTSPLAEAALPTLFLLLRKPHLPNSFHAALVVVGGLCASANLGEAVKVQLLELCSRQINSEAGPAITALLVMVLQLQSLEFLPAKVVRALLSAGPDGFAQALPEGLDCSTLVGLVAEACVAQAARLSATAQQAKLEELEDFVKGLLRRPSVLNRYGMTLAQALLKAFCMTCLQSSSSKEDFESVSDFLKEPIATLSGQQPLALSAAVKEAVDFAAERGWPSEPLSQLLVPSGSALQTGESIVPIVQSFTHESADVRIKAVRTAMTDLQSAKSASAKADARRHSLLVSLILQSAADENKQVAKETLSLEAFWFTLPQVTASQSLETLETLLIQLVSARSQQLGSEGAGAVPGRTLHSDLRTLVLEDPRVSALLPQIITCLTLAYSRSDCSEELQQQMEALVIPFILCVLRFLDSEDSRRGSAETVALRKAVLDFCAASSHQLLPTYDDDETGRSYLKKVADAVDLAHVPHLCRVAQGKLWMDSVVHDRLLSGQPLGALAAQVAAAATLAESLPRLVASQGSADIARMEQAIVACAEACRDISELHDVMNSEAQCVTQFTNVVLAAATSLSQSLKSAAGSDAGGHPSSSGSGSGGAARKKRRKTTAGSSGGSLHVLQRAVLEVLQVALARPQDMASTLRCSVQGGAAALSRPALLRMALVEGGSEPPPMTRHAILLLRSLLSLSCAPSEEPAATGVEQAWHPHPCLLLPLVARLASVTVPEARSALLSLLEVLRSTEWAELEANEAFSWESPLAKALVDAQVIALPSDSISAQAWAGTAAAGTSEAAKKPSSSFIGLLPTESMTALVEHMAKFGAELHQDRTAMVTTLASFLTTKHGTVKASRLGDCACWLVGISAMSNASEDGGIPELLEAIPLDGAINSLQDGLAESVQDMLQQLEGNASMPAKVPRVLLMLAAKVSTSLKDGQLPGNIGEKGRRALESSLGNFVETVSKPLCDAVADADAESAALSTPAVARLMCTVAAATSSAAANFLESDWASVAAETLLRLYASLASVTSPVDEPEVDMAHAQEDLRKAAADASLPPRERIVAAAHAAFVATPLNGLLLKKLLTGDAVKGVPGRPHIGKSAMDAIHQHLALFKGSLEEANELLHCLCGFVGHAPDAALHNTIRAIAALCEHAASMAQSAKPDVNTTQSMVTAVCNAMGRACKSLTPGRLTAAHLAVVIRTCAALAPLAAPTVTEGTALPALPQPLQICIAALKVFEQPLPAGTLSLLRGCLRRLWCFPSSPPSADPATQDRMLQSRLRELLYVVLLGHETLLEEPDGTQYLLIARGAGLKAALDFTMVCFLCRQTLPIARSAQASGKHKMETDEGDDLQEVIPEDPDETAVDEAFKMLMTADVECRFHCVGSLAQTLAGLASAVCTESSGLGVAAGLLPPALVAKMDKVKARRVLAMGVAVLARFVSEHGLPARMDEAEISTASHRITAGLEVPGGAEDDGEEELRVAALATCHFARCACIIEAICEEAQAVDSDSAKAVKELRALVLRSMAVNHPLTFFRTVCLTLEVPGHHPQEENSGAASQRLQRAVSATLLAGAGEALQDRVTIRTTATESAFIEEENVVAICSEVLKHICGKIFTEDSKTQAGWVRMLAWRFVDGICHCTGKASPRPVIELCMPAIANQFQAVESVDGSGDMLASATSASLCLRTIAEQLGRAMLAGLQAVMPALLQLVTLCCRVTATADISMVSKPHVEHGEALLEQSAVRALQALLQSVGNFLTPYLDQTLEIASTPSHPERTNLLEELAKDIAGGVPLRLLIPALQTRIGTECSSFDAAPASMSEIDARLVKMQRLLTLLTGAFSGAPPDLITSSVDLGMQNWMRAMSCCVTAGRGLLALGCRPEEISTRLLRRDLTKFKRSSPTAEEMMVWTTWCGESDMTSLISIGSTAFAHFALRLDMEELRSRFVKVLDWARGRQQQILTRQGSRKAAASQTPEEIMADVEDALKAIMLCRAMQQLTEEAPAVADKVLLPLVAKDLAASVTAARRNAMQVAAQHHIAARKRKRAAAMGGMATWSARHVEVLQGHTWWWLEVYLAVFDFIRAALVEAGRSSTQERSVEETVEALLEISADSLDVCEFLPAFEEALLTQAFVEAVQGAIVAMVAASGEAQTKRFMTAVLAKSKAEDPEVRLASVWVCHKLWTDLGVQVVTTLSEVLMYAVELLEDEDPRVERAVRSMIKTMEGCTGENLQEHLKH